MKTENLKKRKALSSVMSALILSAAVLTIGGAVWAFSQGAMTLSSEYYAESVINMSDTISERFIIEHVAYIDPNLKVWIYNYGSIAIEVKIQVENEGGIVIPYGDFIPIMAGGFEDVEFLDYPPVSGDNLVITAYTRRENSVYYRYIVPS